MREARIMLVKPTKIAAVIVNINVSGEREREKETNQM